MQDKFKEYMDAIEEIRKDKLLTFRELAQEIDISLLTLVKARDYLKDTSDNISIRTKRKIRDYVLAQQKVTTQA